MANVFKNLGSLAKKGRFGDTKLRDVMGAISHVSSPEARAIDAFGMWGQKLVKNFGAGTKNPKTGMPEYHYGGIMHDHDRRDTNEDGKVTGKEDNASKDKWKMEGIEERFDKDAYANEMAVSEEAGEAYLKKIGVAEDNLQYFKTGIDEKGFGFIQEQKDISESGAALSESQATATHAEAAVGAGAAWDIGESQREEGLRAGGTAYGIAMGEVGEAERAAGEAQRIGGLGVTESERAAGAARKIGRESAQDQYGMGVEQAGIGAGRSLFAAKQQSDVAAARSGFAGSGSTAAAGGRAQRGVMQDYRMQQRQLAQGRESSLAGIEEAYTGASNRANIATQGLAEAYKGSMAGAGFAGQRAESAMAGTEAQYGEGGYAEAANTEARRSTLVSSDISYIGSMGTAGIARDQADLTARAGTSGLGSQLGGEFWENLENYETSL